MCHFTTTDVTRVWCEMVCRWQGVVSVELFGSFFFPTIYISMDDENIAITLLFLSVTLLIYSFINVRHLTIFSWALKAPSCVSWPTHLALPMVNRITVDLRLNTLFGSKYTLLEQTVSKEQLQTKFNQIFASTLYHRTQGNTPAL